MFLRILESYQAAFRGLSREVWLLSLILLVNRSGTMVVIFMVTYLTKELSFAPTDAGNLLALYGLGTMLGIYLGGRISDRVGYRPVILVGLFGTSVALLGLG